MSTMIALLLVLSALVGCAGESLANVKNSPPPDPAPIVYTVEVESYEEVIRDEDGTVLAECAYELPVLSAAWEDGSALDAAASEREKAALAAVETFNSRFDEWKENPRSVDQMARKDQAFRDEEGLEALTYTDDLRCTVYRTEHLVSVSGLYSTWTGGAHLNSLLMSWNFDLDTGTFFTPDTLDEDGAFQAYVQKELCVKAQRTAREMGGVEPDGWYWANYEDTLAEWSSYAVSFDEEGMTVGFSPYELANYAAGPQIFRFSYTELNSHLNPHAKVLLGLEDGQ